MKKNLEKYLDIQNNKAGFGLKLSSLKNEDKVELFKAYLEKYNIMDDNYSGVGIERLEMILYFLSNLLIEGDETFLYVYEKFMNSKNDSAFYYAILGYSSCLKEKAIDKLIELVFNKDIEMQFRVYAFYELCICSGQKFITKIPNLDIRKWPESYLQLESISEWIKKGKPVIEDVDTPIEFDLNNPVSALVSKISKKYFGKNAYVKREDIAIGKHKIVKPNAEDVKTVFDKWNFPNDYKYFLENYVVNNELKRSTNLYNAENLIDCQVGFAYDSDLQTEISDWNKNHIVIGDINGDLMYCISTGENDFGVIYKFYHDEWKFKKVANNFTELLTTLV